MLKIIEHGDVREIQLDRPPVNALNPGLVAELTESIRHASETAGAIVLSGRSGLFSAGLDVPELLALDRAGMTRFWEHFFGLLETVARSPVPVVAAITGHCPAGGAVISIFCDYRVMSRGDFVIGLNETRVGLIVPEVIQQALVRLAGPHQAERLIVAGTLLSPEQAHRAGLVDALTDSPESAVRDAVKWCQEHLALPTHAMLGNRNMMRAGLVEGFDHLRNGVQVARFVDVWFSKDTQAVLHEVVAKLKRKT